MKKHTPLYSANATMVKCFGLNTLFSHKSTPVS